jgi:hypothetical protein
VITKNGGASFGASFGIAVSHKFPLVHAQEPSATRIFGSYVAFPFELLHRVRFLHGVNRVLTDVGGQPAQLTREEMDFASALPASRALPALGELVIIRSGVCTGQRGRVLAVSDKRIKLLINNFLATIDLDNLDDRASPPSN